MANRQYEPFTLFNCRIADMRHIWSPSTTYKGQQTQKPSYFGMFIIAKTVSQWHNEPALAGATAALGKLFATNPQVSQWPVMDGDMPNAEGKSSEFAKGHWIFSASSGNPPNVEIVGPTGQPTKLPNRVGVKSGDYVMLGGTAAIRQNDNRAAKFYLNAVMFAAPGEEIVFANSVSGAELMAQAAAQGLRPTGFSGSPGFAAPGVGGFPGAGGANGPQAGFSPPGGAQPQPGFAPPNGQGFTAPIQGTPATAFPSNHPGQSAAPFGQPGQFSTMTSPSSAPGSAFPGAGGQRGPFG